MNETYSTKDFYLTGYLMAKGHELTLQGRTGIVTFLFSDTTALEEDVNNYYGNKANINPLSYGSSLRNLKSMLHSENTNRNGNSHYVQQSYNHK